MTAIVAISFAGCSSSNDSASSGETSSSSTASVSSGSTSSTTFPKSLSRLYALLKPVVIQTTIQEYLHSIFQNI